MPTDRDDATDMTDAAAADANVEAPPPATDTAGPRHAAAPRRPRPSEGFPWGVLGLLGLHRPVSRTRRNAS